MKVVSGGIVLTSAPVLLDVFPYLNVLYFAMNYLPQTIYAEAILSI